MEAILNAGPWGLLLLTGAVILIAFLREGLVSGTTMRRYEDRARDEIARLTEQWEQRLDESQQREAEWRAIAELHDQRADTAARQVDELIATLNAVRGDGEDG